MNDNEALEFARILIYMASSLGLFYLGMTVGIVRLTLFFISGQFFIRALLLAFAFQMPDFYRTANNYVSTPSMLLVFMAIVVNLWQVRKM